MENTRQNAMPRCYELAASNIGWKKADDPRMLRRLQQLGFKGLEVAPTRLFPDTPYAHTKTAAMLAIAMRREMGIVIPSMQSIWAGVEGNIFEPGDREALLSKTHCAFKFAHSMNCASVVFGCPRARNMPEGHTADEAEQFFRDAAKHAVKYSGKLAVEAVAEIYGTNFLNTTREVFDFVKRLNEPGLSVNLDLGTMIYNNERPADFADDLELVSHIHISEPYLAPIQERPIHKELANLLKAKGWKGFVSVEMKTTDFETMDRALTYVAGVFL